MGFEHDIQLEADALPLATPPAKDRFVGPVSSEQSPQGSVHRQSSLVIYVS